MPRHDALPPSLPPRGLSREAAAQYIGISPVKFDEMVGDGRMPKPKRIDARKVWDRHALDLAFDALGEGPAPKKATGWEDYLNARL
jgi:predicted DNA-binding transcriptional regulator AlpA